MNKTIIIDYGEIIAQNYADNYSTAIILQNKINDFVASPSATSLNNARNAWLEARESYGQSEVARESGTAIDTDQSATTSWGIGSEGQINAWPIDEGYIDYIQAGSEAYAGNFNGGIIADRTINITEELLKNSNEGGTGATDKNISTGWHAIEFLLWGQDETAPIEDKAGQREFTDYTTAENADCRKQYLTTVTNILLNDLKVTWAAGGAFRNYFNNLEVNDAMTIMLTGATFIAGAELSEERMIIPVDNTHRDVYTNAQGVFNVIYGRYASINGASFYELVRQTNPEQAKQLNDAYLNAKTKIDAIANSTKPFDLLIVEENSTDSPFGPVMQGAIALKEFSNQISASAQLLGITLG
jgi:putative iron-regulated protein